MTQTAHLWVFFVLVFGVVLLPGLDMAFVLASALTGGRRSGLAATAGVVAGGICHVAMSALGIVALLRLFPAAFNALLLAGAIYIAWTGLRLLRSRVTLDGIDALPARSQAATFGQALLTSLLNPKAYLFMFAVFPQFLKPEYGNIGMQAVVLWLIIALTQILVYGGMALAGERVRHWLSSQPAADRWLARIVGALLLVMAAYTALESWRLS